MHWKSAGRLVLAVIVTTGCGDSRADAPPPASPKPAAATASPAAKAAASDVGVPACDAFLTNWQKCMETNVPDTSRSPNYLKLIEAMRSEWKTTASTPKGKAGLVKTCTDKTTEVAGMTRIYGCTF